jgi:4-hydroxybenzoate polyprenyltransferase
MVSEKLRGMQPAMEASVWRRFALTLEMIKFEHSVFALPFALTGALLAWRASGFATEHLGWKLFWIVVAMVAARSAAMAFNRVADAGIDARNPRTKMRHLPTGALTRSFARAFVAGAAAVFVLAAAMLNPLCLKLAPAALAILFFYSWTKRFTALSHWVLGFALGMAPAAAWIAMTGALDARILWLTAGVTLWTAGFDIIYACQDYEFDREHGLYSVPAAAGVRRGLWLSLACHAAAAVCFAMLAWQMQAGAWAWLGAGAALALLGYEQKLVQTEGLKRVDMAFFTLNGWVSVIFFAFWAVDILVNRRG